MVGRQIARLAANALLDASQGTSSREPRPIPSTVRFASRRQALVQRTGWSGVRRKRFAKPGRPQRLQRRSFVVGQPHELACASQPQQAQTRERSPTDVEVSSGLIPGRPTARTPQSRERHGSARSGQRGRDLDRGEGLVVCRR